MPQNYRESSDLIKQSEICYLLKGLTIKLDTLTERQMAMERKLETLDVQGVATQKTLDLITIGLKELKESQVVHGKALGQE